MNTENAPHDNVDVRLQNRMTFNHSHITVIFVPVILLGFFVFGSWVIFFPHNYLSVVPWIIGTALVVAGLSVVACLLSFVVHFIGTPIARLIKEMGDAITDMRLKWYRRDYLDSGPNHAAYLEEGKVVITPVVQERHVHNHKELPAPLEEERQIEAPPLPTFVRYEDIRPLIPRGHTLVGVGPGLQPVTIEDGVRALLWVVGGSGAGKTTSVVVRIDDDAQKGHRFYIVDPHKVKEDSLSNAISSYASSFIMPIAQKLEEIEQVLQAFLDEFLRRSDNPTRTAYQPVTIVIDEVGRLTQFVDDKNAVAVNVARMVKQIATICGTESRGFNMYGIFISQKATGLAWLRTCALMVIAHQTLMMNERLLVCNNNREIANDMGSWPKGRTLVYGIAFDDIPGGQILVQQPYIGRRIVESFVSEPLPDLAPNPNSRVSSNLNNGRSPEGTWEVPGRDFAADELVSVKKSLQDIGKRLKNGEKRADILRSLDATSGRANQEIGAVIDAIAEQLESEA